SIIVTAEVTTKNVNTIKNLYDQEFIENIKRTNGELINKENLDNFVSQFLQIELVIAQLGRIHYYLTFNDFVSNNRYEIPDDYYILELKYRRINDRSTQKIETYEILTSLIQQFEKRARFTSIDKQKSLFLVHENLFVELSIDNINYEAFIQPKEVKLIESYIDNLNTYKERQS